MTGDQHTEVARRVEYDDRSELSFVVVEAVAAVSDSSLTEIGPINDVLDPEALCELFAPRGDGQPRAGGTVSFRLDGYRVAVDGAEREILVYE